MTVSNSFAQVTVWIEDDGLDEVEWEYIVTIHDGKPQSVQKSKFVADKFRWATDVKPRDVPQGVVDEVECHMIPKGAFTKSGEPTGDAR